jgi:tetratricopeptide (TPR) repeat protein
VEALYAHPLALYWAERPGERDRALDIARRDVARRPAPDSWDVLAWVHFRRGELEQSLEASDNAFFVASASPTILYHRARILHALGRSDEASLLLRTAIAQRAQLDATARIDLDRTNLPP